MESCRIEEAEDRTRLRIGRIEDDITNVSRVEV